MRVGLAIGARGGIAPFVGQGAQYEGMVVASSSCSGAAAATCSTRVARRSTSTTNRPGRPSIFMRDACQRGFYAKGFDTMREEDARILFQKGGAVFMRNWPYAYPSSQDSPKDRPSNVVGRFGMTAPAFDGNGTTSATGGHNLAVSKFSKSRRAARTS